MLLWLIPQRYPIIQMPIQPKRTPAVQPRRAGQRLQLRWREGAFHRGRAVAAGEAVAAEAGGEPDQHVNHSTAPQGVHKQPPPRPPPPLPPSPPPPPPPQGGPHQRA